MNDFIRTFLHVRDGDLNPMDSWRKRKIAAGKRSRFQVGFVRPLECLAWGDFEQALLGAAESRAMFAWFYARHGGDIDAAVALHTALSQEHLVPLQDVIGAFGGCFYHSHCSFHVSLFSIAHIPPEERQLITLEQLNEGLASVEYKQTP